MDSRDEYQRRAADCLLLARLMPTEQDRRVMLAAARRWRELAGETPGSDIRPGRGKAQPDSQLQWPASSFP